MFWFNAELRYTLVTKLEQDPETAAASSAIHAAIQDGDISPSVAAGRVVQGFLTKKAIKLK